MIKPTVHYRISATLNNEQQEILMFARFLVESHFDT